MAKGKKTHGKCIRKGKSHGKTVCRKFAKAGRKAKGKGKRRAKK